MKEPQIIFLLSYLCNAQESCFFLFNVLLEVGNTGVLSLPLT